VGKYPRLVYFAPALVGASDPRLVLRRLRRGRLHARGYSRSLPEVRRHAPDAGRGRARYVVLFRALALLDAWLAGRNARFQLFLSDGRARDGVRHYSVLGHAHDVLGHRAYRQSAF